MPFFQRQRGLLTRAVESVFAQQDVSLDVIIIDDESPIPAEDELRDQPYAWQQSVRVVRQPNGGPGAARNAALDLLADETELVAFLDSDDAWTPGHLARARAAIGMGAEFYFTDYRRPAAASSAFALGGFGDDGMPLCVVSGAQIHLDKRGLFECLLKRCPVGTSTVVARRTLIGNHRFTTDFTYGEDVFFWMNLMRGAPLVAYSTEESVIYGEGVNIAAATGWGTTQGLHRVVNEIKLHDAIRRAFALTPEQEHWSSDYTEGLAAALVASLLHALRHGHGVPWRTILALVARYPRLPLHALRLVSSKLTTTPRNLLG